MVVLTLCAAVGSGVVAGIWFAFSNFVMAALARLPAEPGSAAMRAINESVLNPGFFLLFFGTGAASLALAVWSVMGWERSGSGWVALGSVLYLVGSIGVTGVRNVPLNDALAAAEPGSAAAGERWTQFLESWTFWNHVRCAGTAAAAVAFSLALAAS